VLESTFGFIFIQIILFMFFFSFKGKCYSFPMEFLRIFFLLLLVLSFILYGSFGVISFFFLLLRFLLLWIRTLLIRKNWYEPHFIISVCVQIFTFSFFFNFSFLLFLFFFCNKDKNHFLSSILVNFATMARPSTAHWWCL